MHTTTAARVATVRVLAREVTAEGTAMSMLKRFDGGIHFAIQGCEYPVLLLV
jgi:hypothetical protein